MRRPILPCPRAALCAALAAMLLALSACAPTPGATNGISSATEIRLSALLRDMTVEEKVGQLLMVYFKGPEVSPRLAEMIGRFHVGGLLIYDSAGNVQSMQQVARLVRDAQDLALAGRHRLGLFVAVDQEGGPVARLREGFAATPPNMAVAAAGGPEAAALAARVTARQLRALGINMNLTPVVDVNSNPANPIIGVRSYGAEPELVARCGAAAVRAYIEEGVMACAKHFPGHGDTAQDSHLRLPRVDHGLERLRAVEFPPFAAAIAAGVPAVMTAHVEVPAVEPEPGLPATMSRRVLTGLLRGELGFDGLVLSDSLGMGAVAARWGPGEAALRTFLAGADVLLFGADKGHEPMEQRRAFLRLVRAVDEGEISRERLDASVRRILLAKLAYGLDRAPEIDPARVDTPADREAVRELAEGSVTVLRDADGLLPLAPESDVLLLCPGPRPEDLAPLTDLAPGLRVMRTAADPGPGERAAALEAARGADWVVVLTRRSATAPGQAALVRELLAAGLGPRLAAASLDAPYDAALTPDASCLLAAYSDAPASLAALGGVLFGRLAPRGKLPVEIPGVAAR